MTQLIRKLFLAAGLIIQRYLVAILLAFFVFFMLAPAAVAWSYLAEVTKVHSVP